MSLLHPVLPSCLSPRERFWALWFFRIAGAGLLFSALAFTGAATLPAADAAFPERLSGFGPLVGAGFVPEVFGKQHDAVHWIACLDVGGTPVCARTAAGPPPGIREVR